MNLFEIFLSGIPVIYAGLFPVLNPLGSAFLFLGLTKNLNQASRRRLATRIAVNSFVLLTLVLWGGEWVLKLFGISVGVVEVGGGLVVTWLGWHMMNEPGNDDQRDSKIIRNDADAQKQAFFPLTMPITAGPGSIAVALTIGTHTNSPTGTTIDIVSKLGNTVGIFFAALTVYFCYAYAGILTKRLGTSLTNVIIKLSAFIIFCIGITIFWHGIHEMIRVK